MVICENQLRIGFKKELKVTPYPFLCLILSHNVSVNSYQHQRSSHFLFDFLKLNLCQHFYLVSIFPSENVYSIIFTANKIKANQTGYLHQVSISFAHNLSSWVITSVTQMKTNTEYYTFKAIFIKNNEDWLHPNNSGYFRRRNLE